MGEFMRFIAYANNQQKEEAFTALNARKDYATAAMSLMEIDDVIQRDFDSFVVLHRLRIAWEHHSNL